MFKNTSHQDMDNPYVTLRQKLGRALFIPFVVLGDPDEKKSQEVIETLIKSGADALELGLPFSDPPADGPVIQAADKRALDSGIRIDDCFEIINAIQKKHDLLITLHAAYNLVMQRGIEKFFADCKKARVRSVLVVDLSLEHIPEIRSEATKSSVTLVFVVSELTSEERLQEMCKEDIEYFYLVSYLGVTGVENAVFEEHIRSNINRIRKLTDLPIFVGFGISTPDHVSATMNAGADGVIVGSRIVREIPDCKKIAEICTALKEAVLLKNSQ
jgi:tryptophan synthase alpha chain